MQPAAAPAVPAWTETTLPDGVWKGDLDWSTADAGFGGRSSLTLTVFAHCGGAVQVWKAEGEDDLLASNGRGTLVSHEGLHALFTFSRYAGPEPGWVQATVWSFVEVDAQHLDARLSRVVSNPGVAEDHELRSIGNTAWGRLTKIADRCPPALQMPAPVVRPAWLSQGLYNMPDRLPEGTWGGELIWTAPDTEAGHGQTPVKALLVHCDGELRIYRERPTGTFVPGSPPARVASAAGGTHLVHAVNTSGDPDGWVETTLWTMVEVGDDRLDLRLSRSVSNRMVGADHALRSIHNTAWGQLHQLTKDCTSTAPP